MNHIACNVTHPRPRLLVALAPLLCSVTISALAQGYSIDWCSIDGGGGISVAAGYSLNATIGQPDASPEFTSTGFSIVGGFWSFNQQVAPPSLEIHLTVTNTVVISWPSSSDGFSLQENAGLTTSVWTPSSAIVYDDGVTKFIIVSQPAAARFYRLSKP